MSNRFKEIVNGAAHFEIGAPLSQTQCQQALDSLEAQRWPFQMALDEFALLAKHPVGEGWRFLAPKEEVIAGDEVLCPTGWKPYEIVGGTKAAGTHARRRLPKVEPAYRMLVVGDTVQDGDEVKDLSTDTWGPAFSIGRVLYKSPFVPQYRRPLRNPTHFSSSNFNLQTK